MELGNLTSYSGSETRFLHNWDKPFSLVSDSEATEKILGGSRAFLGFLKGWVWNELVSWDRRTGAKIALSEVP